MSLDTLGRYKYYRPSNAEICSPEVWAASTYNSSKRPSLSIRQYAEFDGAMDLFEKWKAKYRTSGRRRLHYTEIMPPIGALTTDDLLDHMLDDKQNYFSAASIFPKHIKNEQISNTYQRLLWVSQSAEVLDEKCFFYFSALNEFLAADIPEDTLFQQYLDDNETELFEVYNTFNFTSHDLTESLSSAYMDGKILFIYPKNPKPAVKFIGSLTRKQVEQTVQHPEAEIRISASSYGRLSKGHLDRLAAVQVSDPVTMKSQLTRAFVRSLSANFDQCIAPFRQMDTFTTNVSFFIEQNGGISVRYPVLKSILDHAEDFPPENILAVLFVMNRPNNFIRSGNTEKVIEIIDAGFKASSPVVFSGFILATLMEYDGTLPSYREWISSMSDGSDFWEMPPSLSISMIAAIDTVKRSRNVGVELELFRNGILDKK